VRRGRVALSGPTIRPDRVHRRLRRRGKLPWKRGFRIIDGNEPTPHLAAL
jgi:hypothetical protein